MTIPSQPPVSSTVSGMRRSVPKPVSLQRRFLLMQAAAVTLALWLIAMALYLNLRIQGKSTASLQHLQTTFALNSEIHSSLDQVIVAFWRAYSSKQPESQAEYDQEVLRLRELTSRYSGLGRPEEEQDNVESLSKQEEHLLAITGELLAGQRDSSIEEPRLEEVRRFSALIQKTLQRTAASELHHLQSVATSLDEYTNALLVLLLGCALFAVVAIISFRHAHRHHLWGPLAQMRQMVLAVRSGNLNVTGEIPPSVEFGTLVNSFLGMAGDLREMRDSLEQKVKERTAKLESTQKELLQAAKLTSLGRLVSGVAHEINNPLTSILGFSELLLAHSQLAPSLQEQVRTIREEALRLKYLVANLSTFARSTPQLLQRIDLRTVLDRLVDLRHYQLAADKIQLQYDRPALAISVQGDADSLLQVLLNLVANAEQAIKCCREHGTIALACGIENDLAWMEVRDDGEGMTPSVQDHLFEPFFTTRPTGEGSGFGLSVSHGIIAQHDGKITFESSAGKGTTARITLPLSREETTVGPAKPSASPAAKRDLPSSVLILDDEPAIGEMVSEVLARRKCAAVHLQDTSRLDACLASNRFDFVLCDLKMPGEDGIEILRRLRVSRPELARRFLLMTGNLPDGEMEELGLASTSVLRKPFTLNQLLDAIGTVMQAAP